MSKSLNVFPVLRYKDGDAAIEWLKAAFGCEEKAVYRDDAGVIQHAELRVGAHLIMFGQYRDDGWMAGRAPDPLSSPQSLYVVVDDPDAHHARAKGAGAQIVQELSDQDYGSRDYSARDLEGHLWSFGTYDPLASE